MPIFRIRYRTDAKVKSVVIEAPNEASAGKAFSAANPAASAEDVIKVTNVSARLRALGAVTALGVVGPFLDCLEACQDREGHYADKELLDREVQDERHRAATSAHNLQCEEAYNLRMARGVDATAAALTYSHCVRY